MEKIAQMIRLIVPATPLRVIIAVAEHALIILGMGCASPLLARLALTPLIALAHPDSLVFQVPAFGSLGKAEQYKPACFIAPGMVVISAQETPPAQHTVLFARCASARESFRNITADTGQMDFIVTPRGYSVINFNDLFAHNE